MLAILTTLCSATATALIAQGPRRLTAVRDLTISSTVADLSKVGDMMVARSGEIMITEWDDQTIRVFSPTLLLRCRPQETRVGQPGETPAAS